MFVVSYGSPSDPDTRSYERLGNALRFAQARPYAMVYSKAKRAGVVWIRDRWYTNLLAQQQVKDPKKILL